MEFFTYRLVRLTISALIFVASIFAMHSIRVLDGKTPMQILQYIDRTTSDFYSEWKARKSDHLRVVDLGLTLADKAPTIKQACAQLLDSLMEYHARAVAVDLFFDPYVDPTGLAELLRAAQHYPNTVFGFQFRRDEDEHLVGKFKSLGRHAVPYPQKLKEKVQKWPDHNQQSFEPFVTGLAETAGGMGFLEIFPEINGRLQFYPLFHRLAGVDSLFAGLGTQAFRLWVETEGGDGQWQRWTLEDYLAELGFATVDWENDYHLKIHRISAPMKPDVTWKDIDDRQIDLAMFAGKMVLIVNTPTEKDGPLDEADYPLWGYHVSVISQLLDQRAGESTDWIVWLVLTALYAGWVYVRLWPSKINHQMARWRYRVWTGIAILLLGLPLALPGQNLIRNSPISVILFMGMALLTFEILECRLLRLREISFAELHLVLDETESGTAQISIEQAPVRIGKRAIYDLPADRAEFWRNHKRPPYIKELLEMRALGEALYDFIMAGKVGSVFEASLEKAVSAGKILRLRIRNESAGFDSLPFEMLRDSVKGYGYLALHNHLAIARDLTANPSPELHWTLPLRLLVLIASPEGQGYERLDLEAEKNKILHGTRLLQRKGWLQLKVIDHATHAILESLPDNSFDVIHFAGHGTIDHTTQSNCLVFEGPNGEPEQIDAEYFGQRVHQIGPKLILLNACSTGEGAEEGVFINIGRELQRTTGAVIIAQQYFISETGGNVFSDAFYKTFAETLSPELALNRARQMISGSMGTVPSDWVSPVYFIR